MSRKVIIVSVVLLAALGLIFTKMSLSNRKKAITVRVGSVSKGDLKSYLSTSAVIKSKKVKEYYTMQLRTKSINVKVGGEVKAGDVLLTFDTVDLNTAVKQAELNYSNAKLQRKMLENNNEDIKRLDSEIKQIQNKISILSTDLGNELSIAEQQVLLTEKRQLRAMLKPVSEEQLKQAENSTALTKLALESAKDKVENGKDKIVAEFDGVITAVNITEGGVGNPAIPVLVEMDLSNLKAVVAAGKYDAPKIKLGQTAEIKTENGELTGSVSFIDPVAKKIISTTGGDTVVSVEVDIPSITEGLKIDFDTDINILIGSVKDVVKIPSEAIKSDKEGNASVFVVEDGRAMERKIKLGIQSDMESEVKAGLKTGERVILNPTSSLVDGAVIRESN